jgi:hypothetical protein
MDLLLLRKSRLCLALPGSGGIQDKGLAQHGNSFILSPRRKSLHFTVDDKAGSIAWSENNKASFSLFTF